MMIRANMPIIGEIKKRKMPKMKVIQQQTIYPARLSRLIGCQPNSGNLREILFSH